MKMAKRTALYVAVALATFLMGASVAKFHLRPTRSLTPWQVLLSFQDRDLKNLPDKQSQTLQAAINRIIGPENEHEFPFSPRLFQTITSTTGQTRYVLVREQPLLSIPGEPRIRMHVFDNAGTTLTSDEFSGGWRSFVTGVSVAKDNLLHQDTLIVDAHYWVGEHTSRQYYVLDGDRMVSAYFARDGVLKRGDYLLANGSIAPSIP
jgi:hypothetical protein